MTTETATCTCRISGPLHIDTLLGDGAARAINGRVYEIVYCPTHAAAPTVCDLLIEWARECGIEDVYRQEDAAALVLRLKTNRAADLAFDRIIQRIETEAAHWAGREGAAQTTLEVTRVALERAARAYHVADQHGTAPGWVRSWGACISPVCEGFRAALGKEAEPSAQDRAGEGEK